MNPTNGEPFRDSNPSTQSSHSNENELVTEVEIVFQERENASPRSQIAGRKQSIFERMLSPQTLQIMMSAGGAILAIGFAIWLWSLGAFDNPVIAALAMGATNLGFLGLGVLMVTRTRYSLAGRGLTFLSALLLPLHLWFYSAQELIVVSQGGHLWIPALLICGLYAIVARLTRDSAFVYQLVGGIVLTGLLFLAGPQMAFLTVWPVIPTCLFLVALGTLAIHIDRFFVEADGAFSRNEFGKAFFVAGHLTIAGGLSYLLMGQLAESLLGSFWSFGKHAIGGHPQVNFWSLPILASAVWAYAFSHISRGRDGRYLAAASVVMGWSVLTALHVFSITLTPNFLLLLVAICLLSTQIGIKYFAAKNEQSEPGSRKLRSVSFGEVGISIANSLLAATSFAQAIYCLFSGDQSCTWIFLAQGLVTGLSLAVSTELVLGEKNVFMSNLRLAFASALLVLISVLGLESLLSISPLVAIGIATGAVALLSVVAQILNLGRSQQMIASVTTGGVCGVLIAFSAALVTGGALFGTVPALAIGLVSGICLLHVGLVTGRQEAMVASSLVFAMSLAQIAVILNITSAYAIIAVISIVGLILLIGSRALERVSKGSDSNLNRESLKLATKLGNLAIAAGSVAAILFVIPRMMMELNNVSDCFLTMLQLLPLGLGYAFNRSKPWQNAFMSLGISTAVLTAVAFTMVSSIPVVHRFELIVLSIGLATLVAGHIGWFHEQETRESALSNPFLAERFGAVSANLGIGSFLIAIPMILGILTFRFFDVDSSSFWKWFHEIGGLTAGLLMLGNGILCKIRSTTIAGFAILAAFLASLVVLIRLPEALQSVSVLMMVGGGLFFAVGILLSIYRDWILGLPAKIKEGDGVFKVLKWR